MNTNYYIHTPYFTSPHSTPTRCMGLTVETYLCMLAFKPERLVCVNVARSPAGSTVVPVVTRKELKVSAPLCGSLYICLLSSCLLPLPPPSTDITIASCLYLLPLLTSPLPLASTSSLY